MLGVVGRTDGPTPAVGSSQLPYTQPEKHDVAASQSVPRAREPKEGGPSFVHHTEVTGKR